MKLETSNFIGKVRVEYFKSVDDLDFYRTLDGNVDVYLVRNEEVIAGFYCGMAQAMGYIEDIEDLREDCND